MVDLTNNKIGDVFTSPITGEKIVVTPATYLCKGCIFYHNDKAACWGSKAALGFEGSDCCKNRIFKKMENNFKEHWTPGNIVVLEDGTRYYVINNEIAVGLTERININNYNASGKSPYTASIKSINEHPSTAYGCGFEYNLDPNFNEHEDILWTAEPEVKEMTIAEIEEQLGMNSGTLRVKK